MTLSDECQNAQPWASECPDVKIYKLLLNRVWQRMLYSCIHMATVGVKGVSHLVIVVTEYDKYFADLNLYWIKGALFVCFSFWLRVLD